VWRGGASDRGGNRRGEEPILGCWGDLGTVGFPGSIPVRRGQSGCCLNAPARARISVEGEWPGGMGQNGIMLDYCRGLSPVKTFLLFQRIYQIFPILQI
jgi:hypothetical protein